MTASGLQLVEPDDAVESAVKSLGLIPLTPELDLPPREWLIQELWAENAVVRIPAIVNAHSGHREHRFR